MLCRISRWMISRSQDTGKKLPPAIERHVGRCRDCGAFARASMTVASRLRSERTAFLEKVPDFPLDLGADRAVFETEPRTAEKASRAPRRLVFGLRPLPVAAAALVLAVTAGIIVFQTTRRPAPANPHDLVAMRAALKSLTSAPEGIPGVLGQAESSLDRERQVLERSLVAAADYLQSRLNIKIERKGQAKSL
jgi:hypothetical protein